MPLPPLFWEKFPCFIYLSLLGFSGGSVVKNPEIWVQSLGREDPWEKKMATHFSILAWKIPWTEEPGGLQSWGHKESDTTEQLTHKHTQWSVRIAVIFREEEGRDRDSKGKEIWGHLAPHSSTLAWKIPRMEEPGGLQSMGLLRVGHDRATSLLLFTFMHWRRKWQPTPVFLPGESQGQRSLVGGHLWDHTESNTTEVS